MQLTLARSPDQTTRATICRTTRAHQDSTTASSKQTWGKLDAVDKNSVVTPRKQGDTTNRRVTAYNVVRT
jgi:hypothetical protein